MLESMDMETFMDWRRHFHHAPWGEARGDLRMSILASLTANAHRDPKKRSKAYQPKDFLEMTPTGRSRSTGRRVRDELPTAYQPQTPEQFAAQSATLRATFGAQPKPTQQLLAGEADVH
jgi:hypothetical protein